MDLMHARRCWRKYRAALNHSRYFNFQRTVLWKFSSKKRDRSAWTPFISREMIDRLFIVCVLTIKSQFIIMNKNSGKVKSRKRIPGNVIPSVSRIAVMEIWCIEISWYSALHIKEKNNLWFISIYNVSN